MFGFNSALQNLRRSGGVCCEREAQRGRRLSTHLCTLSAVRWRAPLSSAAPHTARHCCRPGSTQPRRVGAPAVRCSALTLHLRAPQPLPAPRRRPAAMAAIAMPSTKVQRIMTQPIVRFPCRSRCVRARPAPQVGNGAGPSLPLAASQPRSASLARPAEPYFPVLAKQAADSDLAV